MNTKFLVVVTLLVLGSSFASAQNYTFGFADTNGNLSCNYVQFSISALGNSSGLVSGIDNQRACGSADGALLGLQGKFALGPKFVASGVVVTDSSAQLQEGEQAIAYIALKCSQPDQNGKYHGKFGWLIVASLDGFIFGDNYGYLSCTIPAKGDGDALMRGTIWRNLQDKRQN